VAAVDPDPALVGRAVDELVPGVLGGARVVAAFEEVADWSGVHAALVTTRSALPDCFDTFCALLEREVHVVSSCEELCYPWLRHPVLAQGLQERAVKARRAILGTGVNPGFLMDLLPVVLSGVCRAVRRADIGRVQDATPRRVPFQRKIGAGLDAAAFEARRADGTLRHVGLGESLHFVAHHLGWALTRWEETLEPVLAATDLTCALGPIRAGDAAGVRQVARGWHGDDEVLTLTFQAAIGQAAPRDWVHLDADPPVRMELEGGVHGDLATAAILLNAVGSVREVEPGLRTMADVRPPRCQVPGGLGRAARPADDAGA
jgi:4-hydroxy-tetrahydrodipicolinate reductase